eukprot:Hpha_TRINITY_DN4744_c0_g1::TRINITY_DN4744_c0_g1_i1::g.130572::m.130572
MRWSRHTKESRSLLAALAGRVDPAAGTLPDLDIAALASSLHGLQSQHSSPEISLLFARLLPCLPHPDHLPGPKLASALFGFKSMGGECSQRRRMLSFLARAAKTSGEELSTVQTGLALYGLREQGGFTEVREIVGAITTLLPSGTHPPNGQSAGLALFGLKTMDDSAEVRELLDGLST